MNFLSLILIIVSSLISVAFYTIIERKILSYIQTRKGPNKVGFLGIFQPFSDAIKLFSKSIMPLEQTNQLISSSSPALILMLSMMMWPILPFSNEGLFDSLFSILTFFVLSSVSVYTILLIGWSSNSKYSYLGTIRSVAQMISYEVSLFFIIISSAILSSSYSFINYYDSQILVPFFLPLIIMFWMWMASCLAETNRSPFDFAEGESELVSGFNVEYMGGWFALIFLAEYLSMITLSFVSVILFFGTISKSYFILIIIFLSILFLWIRGTVPRFRYDMLMYLNWKIFLPISITFFLFSYSFSI